MRKMHLYSLNVRMHFFTHFQDLCKLMYYTLINISIVFQMHKNCCNRGCRVVSYSRGKENRKNKKEDIPLKSMQKLLCSSLAALMIAGSGTMVMAKDFSDVDNTSFGATEIDILSDIGVIKGTSDDAFSPEQLVTREQMAALLFRLMLNKDNAGRENTTKFKDLYDSYYHGVISWANASGYILGTSATTFEPTGGITLQDAMAMLVRALGQETKDMNNNYPWSYINAGIKLDLDRGLEDVNYTQTLTRAQTAVLLYNALTSEYLVGKNTTGGNIYYESTSIIEEVFGYSMTEGTLVSTNSYTTMDKTVVKNGYVTLHCVKDNGIGFHITVPFADMNLQGSANDYIGENFRLIYEEKNGKINVLSAVEMTKSESFDNAAITEDGKYVVIGDTKYQLVEEYSDILSTNNNELVLFAYDDNGTLEQVETIEELKPLLGFHKITLMYDNGSENAHRAILRKFELGRLEIDKNGKINLAGGFNAEELTGGFKAPEDVKNGDYVLYFFNEDAKELEIASVLDVISGTVRKITANEVKIGDKNYAIGYESAGITASSIRDRFILGGTVNAVIYKEAVVAVSESVSNSTNSSYLVILDDAHRVYENGAFRFVVSVSIDGEAKNVYVKNGIAKAGEIYRYTVTGDTYNLIAPTVENGIIITGKNEFIQHDNKLDEIAFLISSAENTSVVLNNKNYFTLNAGSANAIASVSGMQNASFITDKNTVIVINEKGVLKTHKGIYNSTITINDGAAVAVIMDNEAGSTETLRYMYISDGSLGNYTTDAEYVRVLSINGVVLENDKTYFEYTVYNFTNNTVEIKLSESASLEIGEDYRTGKDACITTEKADHIENGFVTGYTGSTLTIDGNTMPLAEKILSIRIGKDHTLENVVPSDLYMTHVEYVVKNGEIVLLIAGNAPEFDASLIGNTINVTPDFTLKNVDKSDLKLTEVKLNDTVISFETMTIAADEEKIMITSAADLEAGEYVLTFKLAGKTYTASIIIEA